MKWCSLVITLLDNSWTEFVFETKIQTHITSFSLFTNPPYPVCKMMYLSFHNLQESSVSSCHEHLFPLLIKLQV